MAEGEKIGSAYVEIAADLAKLDAGLNQLPATVTKKILDVQKKTQAQIARNKLEMKVAINSGDMKGYEQLVRWNDQLAKTMERVNVAAQNQARLLRQPAPMPGGGGGKGKGGSGGGGGFGGAGMGLMMLSQTIDDMQYGFRAIVNNVPMVGAAIGNAFGMAEQTAMKFGGALGITAVAINTWIKNWEDAKAIFGGDWATSLSKKFEQVRDSIIGGTSALVNFRQGFASITGIDISNFTRAKEKQEATRKANEAAAKEADTTVGGVQGGAAEERGGKFRAALQRYGGGERLRQELIAPREAAAMEGLQNRQQATLARGEKFDYQGELDKLRQKIRDGVNLLIADALKGGEGAIDEITKSSPAFDVGVHLPPGQMEALRAKSEKARSTAAMLEDSVGSEILATGKKTTPELVKEHVRAAMERGGMTEDKFGGADEVAFNLRKQILDSIKTRAATTGVDASDARAAAIADAKERQKHLLDNTFAGREASRIAESMGGGKIGRDLLKQGGSMSEDTLKGKLEESMKKAGMGADEIGEILPMVAQKLREKTDKAVEQRALDRGISTGAARDQLAKEADKAIKEERIKDAGTPAQVLTDQSYFSKLLVGGLNRSGGDDPVTIAKNQLSEGKTTNKKLDDLRKDIVKAMSKSKPGPATFAPGRARS